MIGTNSGPGAARFLPLILSALILFFAFAPARWVVGDWIVILSPILWLLSVLIFIRYFSYAVKNPAYSLVSILPLIGILIWLIMRLYPASVSDLETDGRCNSPQALSFAVVDSGLAATSDGGAPDIVAELIERNSPRTENNFSRDYPFRLESNASGETGIVFYSRLPISANSFDSFGDELPPGVAVTVTTPDGRPIEFTVLSLPVAWSAKELRKNRLILRRAATPHRTSENPGFLAGGLNLSLLSNDYKLATSKIGFRDITSQRGLINKLLPYFIPPQVFERGVSVCRVTETKGGILVKFTRELNSGISVDK